MNELASKNNTINEEVKNPLFPSWLIIGAKPTETPLGFSKMEVSIKSWNSILPLSPGHVCALTQGLSR